MPKQRVLPTSRRSAYLRQFGRCFYCERPMWTRQAEDFARRLRISLRQARWFECTAEHLTPRSEGGSAKRENIAAACRMCNRQRHLRRKAPSPEAFKELVRERMAAGRWFLPKLRGSDDDWRWLLPELQRSAPEA